MIAVLLAILVAPPPPQPVVATCPDDARWVGHAPPHGHGYACVREVDGVQVRHGWAVDYHHETARIIAECEYREGRLHGRCSRYTPEGRVIQRGRFAAGVPVGWHWRWDALPTAKAERAEALTRLLDEWEVPATEHERLGAHVLASYDRAVDDIRDAAQICGETHCMAAGNVAGRRVIAIRLPTPE